MGWAARSGGQLTVTDERLDFRPAGALAGFWQEQAFSVRIDDIRSVSWRNLRARLELDVGAAPIVLEGSLITRLAVALHAMGVPFEGGPVAPQGAWPLPIHALESGSLLNGVLQYPGWMALGEGGIWFESRGLVEHLAGVRERGLSLDDLHRVSVEGRTVHIGGATDSFSVSVDAPMAMLGAIAALVSTVPLADDVLLPPANRQAGDDVLFEVDATLQLVTAGRMLRGRATLFRRGGLFLRGFGDDVEQISLEDVQRAVYGRLSDSEPDALRLHRADGTEAVLRPLGGARSLARLRELALTLPMVDAAMLGDLGNLRSLKGEVVFAQVKTTPEDAVGFRPGFLVQAPDGIGLVMKDGVDWDHPRGTRVRLTVGADRGLYHLDGRIQRRAVVDPEELGRGWSGGSGPQKVLFIALPYADEIHFEKSRRKYYRVPSTQPVQVRSMRWVAGRGRQPWGREHEAIMADLSASGVGLLLRQEVHVGAYLQTVVPIPGGSLPLEAEVVHVDREEDDDGVWFRHGLRFNGLGESALARLAREVTRRETLAVRVVRDQDQQGDEEEEGPAYWEPVDSLLPPAAESTGVTAGLGAAPRRLEP